MATSPLGPPIDHHIGVMTRRSLTPAVGHWFVLDVVPANTARMIMSALCVLDTDAAMQERFPFAQAFTAGGAPIWQSGGSGFVQGNRTTPFGWMVGSTMNAFTFAGGPVLPLPPIMLIGGDTFEVFFGNAGGGDILQPVLITSVDYPFTP